MGEAPAGPNWGSQFTPRIGTEVLVDFIDNDMDRPLVVAQLYTGADQPPYAAGVESGANHGGTLSGIHSHNFDGGGGNQGDQIKVSEYATAGVSANFVLKGVPMQQKFHAFYIPATYTEYTKQADELGVGRCHRSQQRAAEH